MKTSLVLFGIISMLSAGAFAAESVPPAASAPGSRPLKIIQTEQGLYPLRMIQRGVRHGTASLMLAVGPNGQVDDVLVTAYSHEPFANEAMRVVRQWKFEPGLEGGRPIVTLVNISFSFEVNGLIVIDRKDFDVPLWESAWDDQLAYQPRAAENLDAPPKPVKIVPPTYPQEWADRGITGLLTVEFFIDETGKPRMASCPDGSNPQLAGVALAAVQQWQFTPPTARGKPVLVHARQQFKFGGKT